MNMILLLLVSIVIAVTGQLLLKMAMNRVGRIGRENSGLNWRAGLLPGVLGLCAYAGSTVLWLYVLSRIPLSYAFPFISLGYVGIVLSARFVLHERFDAHRIGGSLLIVLGVVLVSMS